MRVHWKNNKVVKTIFWPSQLYQYRRSNYTGIPKRHIDPRRIQARWRDNAMYSDRKENKMPVITMHAIELSHEIDKESEFLKWITQIESKFIFDCKYIFAVVFHIAQTNLKGFWTNKKICCQ